MGMECNYKFDLLIYVITGLSTLSISNNSSGRTGGNEIEADESLSTSSCTVVGCSGLGLMKQTCGLVPGSRVTLACSPQQVSNMMG